VFNFAAGGDLLHFSYQNLFLPLVLTSALIALLITTLWNIILARHYKLSRLPQNVRWRPHWHANSQYKLVDMSNIMDNGSKFLFGLIPVVIFIRQWQFFIIWVKESLSFAIKLALILQSALDFLPFFPPYINWIAPLAVAIFAPIIWQSCSSLESRYLA